MSTNPDDRTPIPGAPGFFLPSNLSPEERDAYLLRLRFGPSLFKSGQDVSSAGGDESTAGGATSYPGPGVVNPAIMQGFLKAANTPVEKPLSHSAQMVQRILDVNPDTRGMHATEDATPEMAIPQNEQEWMAVNQPGGYGYTPQSRSPPPHMMFMRGYSPQGFRGQAYHVHVRYSGDWDERVFRDYLIAHPETAREYAEVKIRLREKFEFDREGYTRGKTEFIRAVGQKARRE